MIRLSAITLGVVAIGCLSVSVPAQQKLDCEMWASTLAAGSLARPDSQQRAYAGIQVCHPSTRGQGIRSALERRKTVTNWHDVTSEAFAFATRDPEVFDALLRMTHDRSATSSARVLAIGTLLAMVDTHSGMQLDHFVKSREGEACVTGGSPVQSPSV